MFSLENTKSKIQKGRIRSRVYFYILCSLFFSVSSFAQCAMCRAALGGDENKVKAEAINDGIVYLMVIPYILVALIGIYIYRMKKKKS
ncbi:hypothetical protein [Flavobacterium sp. WC2509]|uniref:hypothetical protein n=1 Tax=Flavobacterium sp. WC2509 TaxID=3461406 RepID=UPI004044BEBC